MNTRFAALLLLALACGTSSAQTLRHDTSVQTLAATRDLVLGQTTIIGSYTNTGYATLPAPKVIFALYDANDRPIGRIVEHASADLAPGETWDIRTTTPLVFARYIPMTDAPLPVSAQPAVLRNTSARKAPARAKAAGAATGVDGTAAAKPPVVQKAGGTAYRKPELYDWSKHHRPVRTTRGTSRTTSMPAPTPASVAPAPHRVSPAIRPGYVPRAKTAPSVKATPGTNTNPSPSTKSVH